MDKFEILHELVASGRTVRRYREDKPVEESILRKLIELARLTPSATNMQPLKYYIVSDKDLCAEIFPKLGWAGYLKDWPGPNEGERPTAYLVQILDTRLSKGALTDCGLQLEAIILGAASLGIGACIIKSFNAKDMSDILHLPDWAEPAYVVALGYKNEEVKIVDMKDGDVKYYRDGETHCVPKRSLDELLHIL